MSSSSPAPGGPGHPLAAAAGVHPIPLPTPFPVGDVNAWLIEDDPLTLVDVGPGSARALVALEAGLAARGHRIEDLERVVLTHEHVDHVGLAAIVVERSGAEVAAIDLLAPRLADPAGIGRRETRFMARAMQRHGLPSDVAVALVALQQGHQAWAGDPVPVGRALTAGDRLPFAGRSLEVLYRPGHSMTDTVLLDRERSIAIGGDHLIGAISSNPILACDPAALDPRLPAPEAEARVSTLRRYVASLRETAALAPAVVLAGHGDAVTDVAGLVAERLRLHERRKGKILGLLGEGEPASAFDLARRMWGDTALKQPFLVISEVLGHLDLLIDDDAIVAERADDVDRWRPR
ncbi:hypothetical protein PAI11_39700 [Patulibacter medicamentivorans]|uniref:Metallo-beta-lactamase domain-containing protein n=1 Tax=Patulibacter medicamentivorans TaxID=1097667 RepID=H0EAU5_9ACTN|nr:MBL fold metallo-hydrolase [Patulibacter medicamentivorans]EHN09163.1 hypothetical protein PAI11_39700 [Patulibacter medicamentivorans]